jgi:hypothetical protein
MFFYILICYSKLLMCVFSFTDRAALLERVRARMTKGDQKAEEALAKLLGNPKK